MPTHQKFITALLLVLTGMVLGVLLVLLRGGWDSGSPVQVRYTDVRVNSEGVPAAHRSADYRESGAFRQVAETVVPAVVYIEIEMQGRQSVPDDEFHDFDQRFWDRFLPPNRAQSVGSGVLVSADGYILTNHHVIDGATGRIRVITHDQREYPARIVGQDPSTDLAIIKIDARDMPSLVIGNSDLVQVGDWVMAVGNPFRLQSTVTAGIVSALRRDVDIINDRMRIESFIQTDAAINRGNSGGALVNIRGELIGINTAIASESGSYQGYGFAVPANLAMKIGRDMIEFGKVQRAYLGVEIATLDFQRARNLGRDFIPAVEIRGLVPGGSADRGGLRRGDLVLQVNGHPVGRANHLQERIALLRPGEQVDMTVLRGSRELNVQFTLAGLEDEVTRTWANRQTSPAPPPDLEVEDEPVVPQTEFEAGFTVAELSASDSFTELELVIVRVESGSPAYEAGLRSDDVIVSVDGAMVGDLQTMERVVRSATRGSRTLVMSVNRQGEAVSVTLAP